MLAAALPSAAPPARARLRADAADAAPLDCAGIMESAAPLALRAVPKRRRSDCTAPSNGSDDAAADDAASAPQSRRRRRSPPPPREVHRRANGVPSLRNHTWARKKELMLDWLRSQNGAPVIDGSGDYAAIKEAFDERVALLRPVRTRNDGVPILESHTQARKKQLMLDWLRSLPRVPPRVPPRVRKLTPSASRGASAARAASTDTAAGAGSPGGAPKWAR